MKRYKYLLRSKEWVKEYTATKSDMCMILIAESDKAPHLSIWCECLGEA